MLDLTKPPYREYVELLTSLRESDFAWSRVQFLETRNDQRGTHDASEQERARIAHLMLLDATARDLPLLRFLMEQEIAARRADSFQGAGDTLTILSILLMQYGDASDTWQFWQAKRANFDTWAGGYDIEFLFAWLSPTEVLRILEDRGSAVEVEVIQDRNFAAVVGGLDAWRQSLAGRYPRSLGALGSEGCEAWAELFGDFEGLEHYGLINSPTGEARARLYRRLGRFRESVACWREAAEQATSGWDRVSRLTNAVSDAAKARLASASDVTEIDRLRPDIPSWREVGLGRMATQAGYELAAATEDPACGRLLWATAERWRSELSWFPLVGLQAARGAAARWGEPGDAERLDGAVAAEQARIARLLKR